MKKKGVTVFLDHAASTPIDPGVFRAMKPFFDNYQANPSALYKSATVVREYLEGARKHVSECLETQPDTVIFTSGGTESCATAIVGVVRQAKKEGIQKPHIVTSAIEHHAVSEAVRLAAHEGAMVSVIEPTSEGIVSKEEVLRAITPETVLVTIMYANNELGTIQPVADIGRGILQLRKKNQSSYPLFHSDACQAGQFLDLSVERLHVDLLSLNGSKIYGPKGVGVLYKRRGVHLYPLLPGGGQEFGVRSGTEHVPGIIGFASALKMVQKRKKKELLRIKKIRDTLQQIIIQFIPNVRVNTPHDSSMQLPHFLHVTFFGAEAEALILYLDTLGIAVASGAACATDKDEASHVLLACGMNEKEAGESIRFTLGHATTNKDIQYVKKVLPQVVALVRTMSKHT